MIQERGLLVDTSAEIYGAPRNPTNKEFIPVGHVALEIVKPAEAKDMTLPPSTVWLYSLYVSWCE